MLRASGQFGLTVSHYGILCSGGRDETLFRSFVRRDLDDIQRAGFNGIEGPWINAAWIGGGGYEVFTQAGPSLNEWALERLHFVIAQATERGMFAFPRGSVSSDAGPVWRMAKHWERLTQVLRAETNVAFDLANEWDEKRTPDEIAQLLRAVRVEDRNRHVTVSISGPVEFQFGRMSQLWRAWNMLGIKRDMVTYLAPHFERGRSWAEREERNVAAYVRAAGGIPVYCEEPHRRGYAASGHPLPAAFEFFRAANGAQRAGAVAWCFHNGHFDVREKRLIEQLDDVEKDVMRGLRSAVT